MSEVKIKRIYEKGKVCKKGGTIHMTFDQAGYKCTKIWVCKSCKHKNNIKQKFTSTVGGFHDSSEIDAYGGDNLFYATGWISGKHKCKECGIESQL